MVVLSAVLKVGQRVVHSADMLVGHWVDNWVGRKVERWVVQWDG